MVAIPQALLEILQWQPVAKVDITVESGRLVVEPKQRRRYTLNELLAPCDANAPRIQDQQDWLDSRRVGREVI